ncbi:ABC transporter ATP-binding protein [Candidatus Phycosocius spiralis]|uniref:ABC transporter n=1 Tax=Candidatus Phycosocius spiralis TaxID=2815099 RepID=A0ABQ4PY26_9PROT|nr:ABC transporter ATP-binding protein [Candidatus Phycosocius spiralis]GIU67879.1 ABC transporter [Candidatus Phycosocius spiralis]
MTNFVLEARAISRTFGEVKALDEVSLGLEPGKVLALLGQSGSGKSTLLRVLAGLETIQSGQVFANGLLVSDTNFVMPPEKRPLGMVFQDFALFPHLTTLANVAFGLRDTNPAQRRALASKWLEQVGLRDRASAYPHELSGGEQQRVALARALAPEPKAILMDEPFSGLDPHLRLELQTSMLKTLREAGVAALIVSHDTQEALGVADNVAILEKGRIVQSGLPRAVYQAPKSLEAARALGPLWTLSACANNGRVETPVGGFETALVGPVRLCARPEATSFTRKQTGSFVVTDVRGVGRFVTISLNAITDPATHITALCQAASAPKIGDKVDVQVEAADAFVFRA